MFNILQKTITKPIIFEGNRGLFWQKVRTKIVPAAVDQGIIFKRIDLKEGNIVEANYANVSSARLCTTLENKEGVKSFYSRTFISCFFFAGIDNATIEINTDEVPIMDGSSKEFLKLLKDTELKSQSKKEKYLKMNKKVEFEDDNKKISIEPNGLAFEVDFELNYENKIIGNQRNKVNFHSDDLTDIYNSRTFCLFEDIEKIKKAGLAKGGSLENAIVVDKDKVLNQDGLRNKKRVC